jgi:hypothetical protein
MDGVSNERHPGADMTTTAQTAASIHAEIRANVCRVCDKREHDDQGAPAAAPAPAAPQRPRPAAASSEEEIPF